MSTKQAVTSENLSNRSEEQIFSQTPHLEVKVTQDPRELAKAKKLRLQYHTNFQSDSFYKKETHNNSLSPKKLIEQQQNIIHDGYDSFAEHLIVIDHMNDKVIAYMRLIDAYTAYKIGGYYCETRFNLHRLFNSQTFYTEISRLVIDHQYNNRETAALIWSGLIKHAQGKGIDAIMGTLSLPINQGKVAHSQINHLKTNNISANHCRVFPYQLLPDTLPASAASADRKKINMENPLIDYFFAQGVKLCGDAFWNKEFNTAELFILYQINSASLFPDCIRMNEIELGMLCE